MIERWKRSGKETFIHLTCFAYMAWSITTKLVWTWSRNLMTSMFMEIDTECQLIVNSNFEDAFENLFSDKYNYYDTYLKILIEK